MLTILFSVLRIFVLPIVVHSVSSTFRYGGERYETRELQTRVRQKFAELQAKDEQDGRVPWYIVNAAQSIEDVESDIQRIIQQTLARINVNPDAADNTTTEGSSACASASESDASSRCVPLQTLWDTRTPGNFLDGNKENHV